MDYILRVDKRICVPYNQIVTRFIGFIKSSHIEMVTSKNVEEEVEEQFITTVNRMVDRAKPRRKAQVRVIARRKCRRRLERLWSSVNVLSLKGNINRVKKFYQKLLRNPLTRSRLEKVKKFKKIKRTLPEDSDIKILSEAISLNKNDNVVCFISRDEHFCEFAKEIEEEFNIIIVRVQELPKFEEDLKKN